MSKLFFLPESWHTFLPSETPEIVPWKSSLTMKTGKNDCIYIWQIGYDGEVLHTAYGTIDSFKVITKDIPVGLCGRSRDQQAIQMAKADFKVKYLDGYMMIGSTEPPEKKGMKGHPFKKGCIKNKRMMASPKLNGIRLLCTHLGDSIMCKTYLNRVFTHLKHIENELMIIAMYMGSYVMFDGELYNHKLSFYEITSIVKTVNEKHKDILKIHYHIFDYYVQQNPVCEVRMSNLKSAFKAAADDGHKLKYLRLVPQRIIEGEEQALRIMHKVIRLGYEGLVVKHVSDDAKEGTKKYELSRYTFGKTTAMYKMKTFIDEEGTVIRVDDCMGKEKGLGKLIIKSNTGIEVPIRHGKNSDREKWLRNPSLVVGKLFTFKYFEIGSKGKYVQPTGVGFRDYE